MRLFHINSVPFVVCPTTVPDQVAAWNAGDIAAFMHGYDHAESTTFVSQANLQRGWASVQANYETRCDSVHEIHAVSAAKRLPLSCWADACPAAAGNAQVPFP